MKALLPTPENLTLPQIQEHFDSENKARAYLEAVRWPTGPICPHCGNRKDKPIWKIEANEAKNIREGLHHCSACGKQFTVTVGTIFEDSHIPLRKWLVAWYLLCSSKKGISSLQIQRVLGLGSYRTALFMMHRIRYALNDPAFSEKLSGTVEADETYVGGRISNHRGRSTVNKVPVVAMVERQGKVRSRVMETITSANLKAYLQENILPSATLMTDSFPAYNKVGRPFAAHKSVDHGAKEYVRGNVHTNTVEGYFSLLKRGIIGTFHHVSKKHLPLYLAEFNHRYNQRDVTDGERTVAGLAKAEGKRLTYRPLTQA
ncbi:MAG TPA: IS1595 family transposase [Opitutaceae bacterium]|nr:IS1595 family transposase [Opitutaceae bacterium]